MFSGLKAFEFVATRGIPLPIILQLIHENHMKIDWFVFIKCAIDSNWNAANLKSKILDALNETYGEHAEFGPKIDACIIDCINKRFS
jgi:hypothetical protein